jgi:hypothetical protein
MYFEAVCGFSLMMSLLWTISYMILMLRAKAEAHILEWGSLGYQRRLRVLSIV